MRKVSFLSGDRHIEGTIFLPRVVEPKNPALLFIHGWTSNQASYAKRAKALTKLGFISLTFDLSGHGDDSKNLDEFSLKHHLQDTLAAYDFLKKQKLVDTKAIGVIGSSYGGYLAAILCGKRPVKWLALRAPALYANQKFSTPTSDLIRDHEGKYFTTIIPEKNNWAIRGVEKHKQPVLVIESEKDQIIPHKIIAYYLHAIKNKKNIWHYSMKNADHQLSKAIWQKEFITVLSQWFKTKVSEVNP